MIHVTCYFGPFILVLVFTSKGLSFFLLIILLLSLLNVSVKQGVLHNIRMDVLTLLQTDYLDLSYYICGGTYYCGIKLLIGMGGLISPCKLGCLTDILGPFIEMAGDLISHAQSRALFSCSL